VSKAFLKTPLTTFLFDLDNDCFFIVSLTESIKSGILMIDLHLHSTDSDCKLTPSYIVQRALSLGIKAVAITDHDLISGIEEEMIAGDKHGIKIIQGVELVTMDGEKEIHILGYLFDHTNDELINFLKGLRIVRNRQIQGMLDKIYKKTNVEITLLYLNKYSKHGYYGRAHIAQAMVSLGITPNTQAGFTKDFLANGGDCYLPAAELTPQQAVKMLRSFGAVPVYAHPGYYGSFQVTDEYIDELKQHGLMGLECIHFRHTANIVRQSLEMAERHNLIKTGGSDCHGTYYDPVKMGTVNVPDEWLYTLLKAKESL
jgi:predicted metal-dependent phosphoesterase TrpH